MHLHGPALRWTRWLACALGLGLGGCAEFQKSLADGQKKYLTGSPEGSPVPAPATPPPPTATALVGPAPCPESITLDEPLEQDYGARLHARGWVPGGSLVELGFTPGPEATEQFRLELPLGEQRVVALGIAHSHGAGLVLLRHLAAGGECVVNHWASYQADHVGYSLAGSWSAPDGRLSVLLLKLLVAPGTAHEQPRWVVVGTDGKRAWYALGQPPMAHLLAPAVRLVPSGRKLFLEVVMSRTSRFPLGKDGRFLTP